MSARLRRARRLPSTSTSTSTGPVALQGGEYVTVTTTDGARLHAHVAGDTDGPTTVLAHCWTGTMDTWAPVAAGLAARGHRVVRYDQRGHGRSTLGEEWSSVERLGTDLREVLESLDVRDAVLAGHSMGGMAAQAFAADHAHVATERVRELVLVATASGGLGRGVVTRLAPRMVHAPSVERLLRTRHGHVFVRPTLGRGADRPAVIATRDAFVSTPAEVRRGQLLALLTMDLRHRCGEIRVPTTVVVGTRDTLTPRPHARRMAATIPGARLVEVKGAGHMLPYEATDLLVDLLGGTRS